jgi:hypothetical protein
VKKYQCNWCKRSFTVSKSSCTSTMDSHLKTCFSYIGANNKIKQKVLSLDGTEVDGVGNVTNFSSVKTKSREICSHMIL